MIYEFDAVLLQSEKYPTAAYIDFPFDVKATFGKGRVKVKANFDGVLYRGSIMKRDGIFMLLVTKGIREQIGKNHGDVVHVILEEDTEIRTVIVPDELAQLFELQENEIAKTNFHKFSYTSRKEYVNWINDAKRPATRERRLLKTVELLNAGKKR